MTAFAVLTYITPSTTSGVYSLPPVMVPALGSGPILNVHARVSRETFAGVICVSGECRVPARSRLYIGQSPGRAVAELTGVTWA
jgi:hypothetical protein